MIVGAPAGRISRPGLALGADDRLQDERQLGRDAPAFIEVVEVDQHRGRAARRR
jgi:hypothetical protein